jgi:hypothetical protein
VELFIVLKIKALQLVLEEKYLSRHPKRQHVWNMAYGRFYRKGYTSVAKEYIRISRLLKD